MRSVFPRIIDIPMDIVLNAPLKTSISNTMNIYLEGNKRAAAIPTITRDLMNKVLSDAVENPEPKWIETVGLGFALDMRTRLTKLGDSAINQWLSQISVTPIAVRDYSVEMRERLMAMKGGEAGEKRYWQETHVWMPALGWPRSVLKMETATQFDEHTEDQGRYNYTLGPYSEWAMLVARTLQTIDLPRFNIGLIPSPAKNFGHDPKDVPVGPALALIEQMRVIFALQVLYLIQGPLLIIHANRRLIEFAWQRAYAENHTVKNALDAWKGELDYLLGFKLHPLLDYVASCYNSGKMKTYNGEKEIHYKYGALPLQAETNGKKKLIDPAENLKRLRDYKFYHTLIEDAQNDYIMYGASADQWGKVSEGADKPISIPKLARLIRSLGSVVERLNSIPGTLGWTRLSGDMGVLNQAAADWIVTDGEGFSASPDAVVMGLRKCYSLGNIKANGDGRRHQENFDATGDNATELQETRWSPVPVMGYQSSTGTFDVVSRMYMPIGAYMGETNWTIVDQTTMKREPYLKEFLAVMQQKGRVFAPENYYAPTKKIVPPDPAAFVTDWDPIAASDNPQAVRDAVDKLLGGKALDADNTRYMAGDRFRHRVPVRSARPDAVIVLSDDGFQAKELHWDGNIDFDDSPLSLSHSGSSLESVINSAVMTTTLRKEELPGGGQDQVILESKPGE